MKVKIVEGNYVCENFVLYKFLIVNDELIVGRFGSHIDLAAAAFASPAPLLHPSAAGEVIVHKSGVMWQWKSGFYQVETRPEDRLEVECLLRKALAL